MAVNRNEHQAEQMDKFAVLQLKKKRAREAEATGESGQVLGDALHAEKHVMSEAEIVQMNKAFGYLDPPTAIYTIGKEGKAAVCGYGRTPINLSTQSLLVMTRREQERGLGQ